LQPTSALLVAQGLYQIRIAAVLPCRRHFGLLPHCQDRGACPERDAKETDPRRRNPLLAPQPVPTSQDVAGLARATGESAVVDSGRALVLR